MRKACAADPAYPPVLFVHHASVGDAEPIFAKMYPDARAIADSSHTLYSAFGLGRGALVQIVGPGAAAATVRSMAKGHIAGKLQGDVRTMPGVFLVEGARILWSHTFRHIGDHPDLAAVPR